MHILREPLFHFLLLGAALFGLDYFLTGGPGAERQIVVDDTRVAELIEIFRDGQGRPPNDQEIRSLVVKWTQNEVFYREAQRLGLDQGDDMIRNRLVLKMRNVLFNNAVVTPPEDAVLREWYALNLDKYQTPARLDFEQFQLPAEFDAAAAAQLAADLRAEPVPKPFEATFRRYEQRPRVNLNAMFGSDADTSLAQVADGTWVPLQSTSGWHLVRVTRRTAGETLPFEKVRHQLVRDWQQYDNDRQLAAQAQAIVDRYTIDMRADLDKFSVAAVSTGVQP